MKLETTLNAMQRASIVFFKFLPIDEDMKRYRQYYAFRDRIIRMDERNKMRIAQLEQELLIVDLFP